jgi:RecA/RadA recombinase
MPSWSEIQRETLQAVEDRLERFVREGAQGTPLAGDGVPVAGDRLEVQTGQKRRWYDQQYYVVDVEKGAGDKDDRHLVTLQHFRGTKLVFEVPPATRKALRGVRRVRVFGVDGMKVKLAEDLRRALKKAERGRLVEALWTDDKPLPRPRRAPELNPSQRAAYAALTRRGAALVWGPPGTGKTQVITAAVKDALEAGRTVLIASHTHVAVDNVLEGLLDLELEPGEVVRVASPLTEEKVSPRVVDHPHLLLRKAAELVCDFEARAAETSAQIAENRAAREEDGVTPELEAEMRELLKDRAALDEELRREQAEMLESASVVACTLASLCAQRGERTFDVVILDEAASIEPPYIAVAGSRATKTFGLVGDFLQNAPIAEPAGSEDEDEQESPWLASDIFSLLSITDRASAELHPRCVALNHQYRYPSVIADLVNGFCYDGLLESERTSADEDGATVTLIDTSALEERRLQPSFPHSWWSPLGLELFETIAGHHAARGADVGYVTPYRGQADRAAELSSRTGMGVECGTAHRFQGRQFDIVVVDLMQDDQPRWAGRANLHGTPREASAAKLLNVALTRAKRQLYLFGDWQFIRRAPTPGMRALAGLEGHPNFKLVPAADVLAWGRRRAGRLV